MAQTRFVVEVSEPVPGERVGDVAARIAARFDMDVGRVRKLLQDRTGAVTRPLSRDKADRIAGAFRDAGVAVRVESAPSRNAPRTAPSPPAERPRGGEVGRRGDEEAPANVFLSSTRWVPSPHEDPASGTLVEGPPAAVLAVPGADAEDAASAAGAAEQNEVPRTSRADRGRYAARASGRPGVRIYLLAAVVVGVAALVALQAVDRGHPATAPATVEAGMQAYNGGDFAAARRVWIPLAEGGDARAAYMLGYMAENGQGRPWSNHDAADWYRRAADRGYPQAQVALGQLYQRGMGVLRDPRRAVSLFEAAAKEGYGPGQFQYALALFHGSGTPQDFAAALKWFKAAAANGVAEARPYVSFAGSSAGSDAGATAQPAGRRPPGTDSQPSAAPAGNAPPGNTPPAAPDAAP